MALGARAYKITMLSIYGLKMGSCNTTTTADIDLTSASTTWTSYESKREGYYEYKRGCELCFIGTELLVPIPNTYKYERVVLPSCLGGQVAYNEGGGVEARVIRSYSNYLFWATDVEVSTAFTRYSFTLRHIRHCGSYKACNMRVY